MNTYSTEHPAHALVEHVQNSVSSHTGDTLCFLAGGSALKLLPLLNLSKEEKVRTIFCFGDERISREPTINNYLQQQQLLSDEKQDSQYLKTVPELNENAESFAIRITDELTKIIANASNLQVLCILGMGTDGHTAGIFPLPLNEFAAMYPDDVMYAPVHIKSLKIDSRASLTPQWILQHASEIFGYVHGAEKKLILEKLINESVPMHTMPAQLWKQHSRSFLYTNLTV